MPAPTSNKRIRHLQIYRPFIFGSEAIPFDPASRPSDAPPDHTHKWRVFVRGVNNAPINYWLRRVQFKLHDTYANSVRTVEAPPFEVEETGWGEFEISIKFYFVAEAGEKPQQLWHALKLHPWQGPPEELERQKRDRSVIKSVCYEEVVFSEPYEAFYDVLTGGGGDTKSKSKGKNADKKKDERTAELPPRNADGNLFSREEEMKELDRLGEAAKRVEKLIEAERERLIEDEKKLVALKETEGNTVRRR